MHVFEMVVLIVAISVIGGIIMKYLERESTDLSEDKLNDMMQGLDVSHMEKIIALERRVQVLERIATDKGITLASEIDNLK
ncbi:MAG: hypothetical protein KAI89_10980 [Emcibacter sp.]|nr:hypothetical protein [Emcibacter sp.]